MLKAKNLAYQIKGKSILSLASIKIMPGKLTVLVGPNGAGKSTLLRHLTGELKPQAGRITLESRELRELSVRNLASRRAVLNQNNSVAFDYLVHEVVGLGAYANLQFLAEEDMHQSMCNAGIENLSQRQYRSLSGGEKQRVHLARCLLQLAVGKKALPKAEQYLLLDEPTNNLDLRFQFQLLKKMKELAGLGLGIMAILHDLQLAAQFADQVVIIDEGRTLIQGQVKKVLNPPNILQTFGVRARYVFNEFSKTEFLVTLPG